MPCGTRLFTLFLFELIAVDYFVVGL